LVEIGIVNLVPDLCNFDVHLRDQMLYMAKSRSSGIKMDPSKEPRLKELMEEDSKRAIMSMPMGVLRSQILRNSPQLTESELQANLKGIEVLKQRDPLADLSVGSFVSGKKGGQIIMSKLAPNFEMAMYLAQTTGSSIVTDSFYRWQEIQKTINRRSSWHEAGLATLMRCINQSSFGFPQYVDDISRLKSHETFAAFPALLGSAFNYLSKLGDREPKPNMEASLAAQFIKAHQSTQVLIKKAKVPIKVARISCVFPIGGIQDNTINRLLLMSSSERHLPNVPMAFFIQASKST
jgi:hypothetical protein